MKWLLTLLPFTALIPGASSFIGVIGEFLKPIAGFLGKMVGDFFSLLWDGVKNALDTLSAIIFVCVLVAGTYGYTNHFGPKRVTAETEVQKLVRQSNAQKKKIDELRKLCGVPCRGR